MTSRLSQFPEGRPHTWCVMAGLSEDLKDLGVEGATAAASVLTAKAEDYGNDARLEYAWAIKAMKFAETHMKLLQTYDPTTLKLTRHDDDLYKQFTSKFKDLKLDVITPDDIKSEAAKEVWRPFCNQYDGKIKHFNYGTLLRIDASKEYNEENTILVPRVQFLAIEVTRNRMGLNSMHFKK